MTSSRLYDRVLVIESVEVTGIVNAV